MPARIKLSCTDFTFGLLPHADALSLIGMLGMDGVDVGVFGADTHTSPRDILKDISAAARQLRTKLKRARLALADVFVIPGDEWKLTVNHPEAHVRRQSRRMFQQMVDYTQRCGGRHMTILPGMPFKIESRAASFKRAAEELTWRIDKARRAHITLSVETHIGSIASTPAQTLKLIDRTPGLTLTLDFSHFIYQGFKQADLDPLVHHAWHIHARGAARGHRQSPFKRSTIDFVRLAGQLASIGYKGYIAFEFEFFDADPGDELDTLGETIMLRDVIRKAVK